MRKTLESHTNTSYVSDFPDVLSQLIFFHNAQVTLDEADVVGCHMLTPVAWLQRGLIDEIGGGRKNTQLLTQNKEKIAPYVTTLMCVSFPHHRLTMWRVCGFTQRGRVWTRTRLVLRTASLHRKAQTVGLHCVDDQAGRCACLVWLSVSKWSVTQGPAHFKCARRSNSCAMSKRQSSRPLRTKRRQRCWVSLISRTE